MHTEAGPERGPEDAERLQLAVPVGPVSFNVGASAAFRQHPALHLFDGFHSVPGMTRRRCWDVRVEQGRQALRGTGGPVRFFRDETGAYVSKREGWVASLNPAPPPTGPLAEVRFSSSIDDFETTQRGTALFLAAISACALVLEDAVLVHGAAMLAPDGQRALAFVGPSGAGKTTMTRRLPGWQMLADESLCLDAGMGDGVVRVSGTPFTGKERNPRTEQPYPLAAIVFLHKGAEDARLADVEAGRAMERLMARTYCCASDGVILERHLSVVDRIAARVPMKALHSNLGHDVMSLLAPSAGHCEDLAEGVSC